MGGLFDQPKMPHVTTPSVTTTTTRPNLVQLEKKQRKEALKRKQRGIAGTIATSPRGLLTSATPVGEQKTLLGE